MQRYANISGILGVALFLFGFVTYLFTEVLTLYSVLHLALGTALILYFLGINATRLRGMVTGRAAKTFAETGTLAAVTLASVIVLNMIASMYPKQFDWTREGLFSLSEQTQKILSGLDTRVQALVFQQGGQAPKIESLLKLYAYEQEKFTYRVVDPERSPELAERYEIRQNGTVVLEAGDRRQKVTEDITEEKVTNSLMSLLAGQDTVVGFLTGHDERDTEDPQSPGGLAIFKLLLEEENYTPEIINLAETGTIPAHVDILVIASPTQPMFAEELSAVSKFMQGGGRLLAMADPMRGGVANLLQRMGIENVGSSMLIDEEVQLFAGPTLGTQVLVQDYGDHESVDGFHSRTLFAQACALQLPEEGGDVTYAPILRTSRTSWAESDLDRLLEQQEAERDDQDIYGPVIIGAAFTGFPGATGEAPAGFVICDSDFLSNRFIGQAGNADLALNMVAWMAGETDKIAVRPKKRGMSQLTLTQDQMVNIFYGTVLIFPELLLLLGLFVWWNRRQRP